VNKTPEQEARDNIDQMLAQSGWVVVDKNATNWSLGLGIAVREYPTDVGPAGAQAPECRGSNTIQAAFGWSTIAGLSETHA
jgi:hypothetical protein